jgi:hypothetical protein
LHLCKSGKYWSVLKLGKWEKPDIFDELGLPRKDLCRQLGLRYLDSGYVLSLGLVKKKSFYNKPETVLNGIFTKQNPHMIIE